MIITNVLGVAIKALDVVVSFTSPKTMGGMNFLRFHGKEVEA